MHILKMDTISHSFTREHQVLHNVSLSLGTGEFVCLLGPSGCGKTTLLRLAAGLEQVQKGTITIDGTCVAKDKQIHIAPEKRKVGMMFQDYALFPHLRVMDNILYGVPKNKRQDMDHIHKAMEDIGIKGLEKSYPHTLSGGQQQRVALLRALAPKPKLMLLDEPFSGLDISRRMEMREQIGGYLKKHNITTLMVTHDPEEAMYMSDLILVMHGGLVIQNGTPEEILYSPANEYVAGLFGQMNHFQGKVAKGVVNTVVGAVNADQYSEGAEVNVFIRPEAFRPCQPDAATALKMKVLDARLLGNVIQLRLSPLSKANTEASILVRIQADTLPAVGAELFFTLDTKNVFIFAVEQ
ncbi:MAG: ABC transporter ATP-binding protein [Desulfobulbus propionicus]|nr:MAG: ABC transporter ATP-binding protein [Desulfobulbus propionicus]